MENADEREEDSPESRVPSLVRSVLTQKRRLLAGPELVRWKEHPQAWFLGEERPATPVPRMVFR